MYIYNILYIYNRYIDIGKQLDLNISAFNLFIHVMLQKLVPLLPTHPAPPSCPYLLCSLWDPVGTNKK